MADSMLGWGGGRIFILVNQRRQDFERGLKVSQVSMQTEPPRASRNRTSSYFNVLLIEASRRHPFAHIMGEPVGRPECESLKVAVHIGEHEEILPGPPTVQTVHEGVPVALDAVIEEFASKFVVLADHHKLEESPQRLPSFLVLLVLPSCPPADDPPQRHLYVRPEQNLLLLVQVKLINFRSGLQRIPPPHPRPQRVQRLARLQLIQEMPRKLAMPLQH
mmetsp:Transcript_22476/g.73764  ORF Transcript_22476/g.73764 Transcript_22476/m.73764 type:complete len:219 (+) Transcript_22476:557-1213(+)